MARASESHGFAQDDSSLAVPDFTSNRIAFFAFYGKFVAKMMSGWWFAPQRAVPRKK